MYSLHIVYTSELYINSGSDLFSLQCSMFPSVTLFQTKVCTHSGLCPCGLFYSDGQAEKGRKYNGLMNGNNKKILLIKLK